MALEGRRLRSHDRYSFLVDRELLEPRDHFLREHKCEQGIQRVPPILPAQPHAVAIASTSLLPKPKPACDRRLGDIQIQIRARLMLISPRFGHCGHATPHSHVVMHALTGVSARGPLSARMLTRIRTAQSRRIAQGLINPHAQVLMK